MNVLLRIVTALFRLFSSHIQMLKGEYQNPYLVPSQRRVYLEMPTRLTPEDPSIVIIAELESRQGTFVSGAIEDIQDFIDEKGGSYDQSLDAWWLQELSAEDVQKRCAQVFLSYKSGYIRYDGLLYIHRSFDGDLLRAMRRKKQ